MGSRSDTSGCKVRSVFSKAVNFSACSVIASALSVTATLPRRLRNLPIRSAAREPLAIVSTETTASRLEWGASVETQTMGVLDREARRIQVRTLLGRLG